MSAVAVFAAFVVGRIIIDNVEELKPYLRYADAPKS